MSDATSDIESELSMIEERKDDITAEAESIISEEDCVESVAERPAANQGGVYLEELESESSEGPDGGNNNALLSEADDGPKYNNLQNRSNSPTNFQTASRMRAPSTARTHPTSPKRNPPASPTHVAPASPMRVTPASPIRLHPASPSRMQLPSPKRIPSYSPNRGPQAKHVQPPSQRTEIDSDADDGTETMSPDGSKGRTMALATPRIAKQTLDREKVKSALEESFAEEKRLIDLQVELVRQRLSLRLEIEKAETDRLIKKLEEEKESLVEKEYAIINGS